MTTVEQGSPDQIPLHEIVVDWDAFGRLSAEHQSHFLQIVTDMERTDWFGRTERPKREWACIDLSEYADYAAFVKKLKKQGAAFYEGRKAEKRGYYTKFFYDRTFIADLYDIHTSAPERQGRPMTEAYRQTVEQMGGYPQEIRDAVTPTQAVFWFRNFGTFRTCPGHRQGPLVVDENLVSYLTVRRYGNFVHYGTIIGHKDRLQDGVVYKMHLDFVKAVLDARHQAQAGASVDVSLLGIRYIGYAAYFGFAGLMRWKKSNLFQPGFFRLDYIPAVKDIQPVKDIEPVKDVEADNDGEEKTTELDSTAYSRTGDPET